MKSLLIAAGVLMTGASVYGVVDYNQKSSSEEFRQLYKETAKPVEPLPVKEIHPAPPVQTKSPAAAVTKEKTATKKGGPLKKKKGKLEKRVFNIREFSRSRLG